ncbi:MAG: TVP38/TMEM64 family protein [Nitrospirota bacterium]|nr:TVP38/TMEM64 family protein [Nitrospirota bacterium]
MFLSLGKWLLLLLVIAGVYWVIQFSSLQDFLAPEKLSIFLQELGVAGHFALMGLMTLAVVVSPIPSLRLDLAAGAAYGPLWGAAYVLIGAEFAAILSFLIGRALGREVLGRCWKQDMRFCEHCSDHHLFGFLVVARLVPIFSFDIVSYGAGLTKMSLKAFALATFVGMIPPTVALTYLGSAVVMVKWPIILAGGLLVVLFLFLPKWIVKHRNSWWVRVIQGKPMVVTVPADAHMKDPQCGWCGKSLKSCG